MSSDAIGFVFRRSPFEGATFAVHLAVADSANDQYGNEFWMVLDKLAKKARVSRRSATTALGSLVESGWLELLQEGGGRSRPGRYLFLFPESAAVVYDSRQTAQPLRGSTTQTAQSATQTAQPLRGQRTQASQATAPNGAAPSSKAAELVAFYVDECTRVGVSPLRSWRARVGREIAVLLREGKPERYIRKALSFAASENKQAIAHIVADIERDVAASRGRAAS